MMRRKEVNDQLTCKSYRNYQAREDHMLFSYHDRTDMLVEVSSPIGVY